MVYTGHGKDRRRHWDVIGIWTWTWRIYQMFTKQNPESQDEVFCYHGCAVKKMVFDVSWIGTHGN